MPADEHLENIHGVNKAKVGKATAGAIWLAQLQALGPVLFEGKPEWGSSDVRMPPPGPYAFFPKLVPLVRARLDSADIFKGDQGFMSVGGVHKLGPEYADPFQLGQALYLDDAGSRFFSVNADVCTGAPNLPRLLATAPALRKQAEQQKKKDAARSVRQVRLAYRTKVAVLGAIRGYQSVAESGAPDGAQPVPVAKTERATLYPPGNGSLEVLATSLFAWQSMRGWRPAAELAAAAAQDTARAATVAERTASVPSFRKRLLDAGRRLSTHGLVESFSQPAPPCAYPPVPPPPPPHTTHQPSGPKQVVKDLPGYVAGANLYDELGGDTWHSDINDSLDRIVATSVEELSDADRRVAIDHMKDLRFQDGLTAVYEARERANSASLIQSFWNETRVRPGAARGAIGFARRMPVEDLLSRAVRVSARPSQSRKRNTGGGGGGGGGGGSDAAAVKAIVTHFKATSPGLLVPKVRLSKDDKVGLGAHLAATLGDATFTLSSDDLESTPAKRAALARQVRLVGAARKMHATTIAAESAARRQAAKEAAEDAAAAAAAAPRTFEYERCVWEVGELTADGETAHFYTCYFGDEVQCFSRGFVERELRESKQAPDSDSDYGSDDE